MKQIIKLSCKFFLVTAVSAVFASSFVFQTSCKNAPLSRYDDTGYNWEGRIAGNVRLKFNDTARTAKIVGVTTLFIAENLVIPNSIIHKGKSYILTTIDNYAFYQCTKISGSITLPETLTEIGNFAFFGCTRISGQLILPSSLQTIGTAVFSRTGITSVDLNSLNSVSNHAFEDCNDLYSVNLGNAANIGFESFALCPNLNEISKPSSNNTFKFVGAGGIINEDKITNGFVIRSDTIPLSAGPMTIYGCGDNSGPTHSGGPLVAGNITIPPTIDGHSVTAIGDFAFYSCARPIDLSNFNNVTAIGSDAFNQCNAITSFNLDGVESIGTSSFYHCTYDFQTITIPDSVEQIGYGAFSGCNFINIQNSSNTYFKLATNVGGAKILLSASASGNYNYAENSDTQVIGSLICGDLEIPSGIETIVDSAFGNCSNLTSLSLPNDVKKIESNAFANCSGLTDQLDIPSNVETINSRAFAGCNSFTSIACSFAPSFSGLDGQIGVFDDWKDSGTIENNGTMSDENLLQMLNKSGLPHDWHF